MPHIERVGVSHDGGPSPMYWVTWLASESLEFSSFSFPNVPGVSVLLWVICR